MIAQHLAVRLEECRKRSEARRDCEQIRRALALLPERRAHAGSAAWEKQGPRSGFAEPRGEQRRRSKLPYHERFHIFDFRNQQSRIGRVLDLRKSDDEPFVAPHDFDVHAGAIADVRRSGHRPWRMDAAAERGEQADPPVAELVKAALDDDGPIVGDGARCGLIIEVAQEVFGGDAIEVVLTDETIDRCGPGDPAKVTNELADRIAELDRSSFPVTVPERHLARLARGGGDQHAIVRDLLDAPRRGTEGERLADLAFEDHLLIELADADRPIGAREKDTVETAIGNRPGVRDRDPLGAFAAGDRAMHAIPGDARPQLRKFVGRVASRQHVEDPFEHPQAQVGVWCRASNAREQRVDVPRVHARHRDHLLREDVERISRIARRLDVPVVHRLRNSGAGEKVSPELRENDPFADSAGLVARPADSLEAARDRWRRFDLDDEIDRAHIDAELERRGGDQRFDPSGLQEIFDFASGDGRERAMMRADEGFARQLIQRAREPLRKAAAVDENEGRPMSMNQVEQSWMDRAPD